MRTRNEGQKIGNLQSETEKIDKLLSINPITKKSKKGELNLQLTLKSMITAKSSVAIFIAINKPDFLMLDI